MKPILVTCYVNPDLDGVASAMAYGEFVHKTGKNVAVGIIGKPHDEAKYILDRFNFEYPDIIENADNYDEVILVDASDLNGLQEKIQAEKVIEIIDHRQAHETDKFINAKAQIELVGAAATLVAEKFMHNAIEISRQSATLLYGAIISNTLNFKGSISTNRDKIAAEWLNQVAKMPQDSWKEMFMAKSDLSGQKLVERIEGDFAWFVIGNQKIGIAQVEMIGAEILFQQRSDEIVIILKKLQKAKGLDYIFQNTIELEEAKNYFVAPGLETQKLLEKVLKVRFSGIIAQAPIMIMRKQIVPLLKAELE